jgi:hypothetical protein
MHTAAPAVSINDDNVAFGILKQRAHNILAEKLLAHVALKMLQPHKLHTGS